MDRSWAANPPHEAGRALGFCPFADIRWQGPKNLKWEKQVTTEGSYWARFWNFLPSSVALRYMDLVPGTQVPTRSAASCRPQHIQRAVVSHKS